MWGIIDETRHGQDRELVRAPLMQLVHSDLAVIEAASRLRPIARAEPKAARLTDKMMVQEAAYHGGYIIDRARRILNAAMDRPPPPPPSEAETVTFERERLLGTQTLQAAFDELASLVPELKDLDRAAAAIATRQGPPDETERRRIHEQLRELVGPDAINQDPLVRSRLSLMLAAQYLRVIEGTGRPGLLAEPAFGRPIPRASTVH